jgi:hypothetical protein
MSVRLSWPCLPRQTPPRSSFVTDSTALVLLASTSASCPLSSILRSSGAQSAVSLPGDLSVRSGDPPLPLTLLRLGQRDLPSHLQPLSSSCQRARLPNLHPRLLSSSILGSSGAWSTVNLADATSHRSLSTILGHRLVGTGRSPTLYCVIQKKDENTCCKFVFQVFPMFYRYVASVFMWML